MSPLKTAVADVVFLGMLHTSGRLSSRTIMGNCFSNSPGLNSTVFVLPKKSSLPKERKEK